MPQSQSSVVYDGLPISSGGAHAINRLDTRSALDAWRNFLAQRGHVVEVRAHIRIDDAPPTASPAAQRLIDREFPTPVHASYPFVRSVPANRLDEAVSLMAAIEPQPTNEWGDAAVILQPEADFLLLDPGGRGLWPFQGQEHFGGFVTPGGVKLGLSSARVNIGSARSMGLMLSVPEATDSDMEALRPWLQEHLPFRLSRKHWTRWILNRNGITYRARRIHVA